MPKHFKCKCCDCNHDTSVEHKNVRKEINNDKKQINKLSSIDLNKQYELDNIDEVINELYAKYNGFCDKLGIDKITVIKKEDININPTNNRKIRNRLNNIHNDKINDDVCPETINKLRNANMLNILNNALTVIDKIASLPNLLANTLVTIDRNANVQNTLNNTSIVTDELAQKVADKLANILSKNNLITNGLITGNNNIIVTNPLGKNCDNNNNNITISNNDNKTINNDNKIITNNINKKTRKSTAYNLININFNNAPSLKPLEENYMKNKFIDKIRNKIKNNIIDEVGANFIDCKGYENCCKSCSFGIYCLSTFPYENQILSYHKKKFEEKKDIVYCIAKIIVDEYKKRDPQEQSIWNSDITRLTYLLRLQDVNNKEMWKIDKCAVKTKTLIIEPFIFNTRVQFNDYLCYISKLKCEYMTNKHNNDLNDKYFKKLILASNLKYPYEDTREIHNHYDDEAVKDLMVEITLKEKKLCEIGKRMQKENFIHKVVQKIAHHFAVDMKKLGSEDKENKEQLKANIIA